MKKIYFIFAFVILITCNLKSQGFDGPKNAVYAELLGNGLIMSFNYDVRLAGKMGGRLGVGYVGGNDASVLTVPVMANYLLGKNGKYFEIGAGITYISGSTNFGEDITGSTTIGTFSLMYRSQPVDGGFMWKIGLTPILAEGFFVPYWAGVGLGYAF